MSTLKVDTLNGSTGSTITVPSGQTLNIVGSLTGAISPTIADESSDTTCFPLFSTAATGNLAPKSGSNLTFNSSTGLLTATLFAGALTGNVTGTASIATTVTVSDNESTNEANVILFAAGAAGSGNLGVEADGNMTYNPSTGVITATGFAGALTGNVTGTSSIATSVTVADESSDTTCFPLFATAATGNLPPKSGTNLTFNSSTGLLTATLFAGALTGNVTGTASIATTVTVSDNESTNESNVILFAAGAAGSGNLGVEADGNMTYNPSTGKITATGFVGALTGAVTGNADTATTSTNVTVADESSDTTCFPLFATAATGDLPPKSGTNLTFNSSSGVLTATGFVGALTGTASIATAVTVTDESSDTTCFPLFASGATSGQSVKSGSNLTFNSSTGLLTATLLAGALTGNVTGTASIATTVTVSDNESTNENNVILFAAGAAGSGNLGVEADGNMTYNPSTGKITATGFVGALTGAVTGNADTATVATTVTVSDNESTNEANVILFAAGAAGSGNLGVEADGNMTYNPSTGVITATGFAGALTGNVTGTADVATVATTVTITDNESTNENNAIIFTAGGDLDGGNLGLESDGTLNYNPSTGKVTATAFAGATVDASGLASLDGGINTNDDFTVDTDGNVVGVAATFSGLTNLTGSFSQAIHTFVATDAITSAEHAGRILLLGEVGGNADVVLTLPDATGTGHVYKFIVTVTMASNTYKIACPDADNVINGTIKNMDLDGTAQTIFSTVAASDTITLNGGTQGGQVSDTLTLIDIAANLWHVEGQMRTPTGANPATPFSEAVS